MFFKGFTASCALTASTTLAVMASLSGHASAEAPAFQAPFNCGQMWRASTYAGLKADGTPKRHGAYAIDTVQRNGPSTIIGENQPVRASAAGTISFDFTWPDGDKAGERWIFVDHADGWRTQYVHLADEPNRPRWKVGRRVAQGEVLGYTSNSGTTGVHLHYSQRASVALDSAELAARANVGTWRPVLSDGAERHIRFDGKMIETERANEHRLNNAGTDRAERIRSWNCSAGEFAHWHENGQPMMLRYKPETGRFRISQIEPGASGNAPTGDGNWRRTWTTVVAYSDTAGDEHILRYNFATGDTTLARIDDGGTGLTTTGTLTRARGWTEIAPLRIAGRSHIVLYNSRYGTLKVQEIAAGNDGFTPRFSTTIRGGYTHVLPYREGRNGYVLMYAAGTGRVIVQRFDHTAEGSLSRERTWTADRRRGWTHMTILRLSGERHLLGYDALSGDARLWRILPGGTGLEGGPELSLDPGWTSLTPYRTDTQSYVLFYRARDGKAEKRRLGGGATSLPLVAEEDLVNGFR